MLNIRPSLRPRDEILRQPEMLPPAFPETFRLEILILHISHVHNYRMPIPIPAHFHDIVIGKGGMEYFEAVLGILHGFQSNLPLAILDSVLYMRQHNKIGPETGLLTVYIDQQNVSLHIF